MQTSFYNGVSGIKTSQSGMDIWGDNIANINTNGYKQNLPEFHNLFASQMNGVSPVVDSETIHASSIASSAIDLSQGSLIDSGETFDLAIAGDGWFAVNGYNKLQNYTRDGSFMRDKDGTVVNQNGNQLLVSNANNLIKNGNGDNYKFNPSINTDNLVKSATGLTPISLPNNITFPASPATEVDFTTNLDTSDKPIETKPATSTSVFNALHDTNRENMNIKDGQDFFYTFGENIVQDGGLLKSETCINDDEIDGNELQIDVTINGTNINFSMPDGSRKEDIIDAISRELDNNDINYEKTSNSIILKDMNKLAIVGNGDIFKNSSGARLTYKDISNNPADFTTMNDLKNRIQELADVTYPNNVTTGIDDKGRIYVNNLSDNTIQSNSYKGSITDNFMQNISNLSKDIYAQTSSKSSEFKHAYAGYGSDIIDGNGQKDDIKFSFIKTGVTNEQTKWQGTFDILDKNGNLLSTKTEELVFNSNGQLISPKTTKINNVGVEAVIDFTKNGGLTSYSKPSDSAIIFQNGFVEGSLDKYEINQNGEIIANFSNGKSGVLGKIPILHFQNEQGLEKLGGNLFRETDNSNKAQIFSDTNGNYLAGGQILSGKIETSNVKMSQAMTEIIISQKAFQASAKSITTSDQMLQKAIDMKR